MRLCTKFMFRRDDGKLLGFSVFRLKDACYFSLQDMQTILEISTENLPQMEKATLGNVVESFYRDVGYKFDGYDSGTLLISVADVFRLVFASDSDYAKEFEKMFVKTMPAFFCSPENPSELFEEMREMLFVLQRKFQSFAAVVEQKRAAPDVVLDYVLLTRKGM